MAKDETLKKAEGVLRAATTRLVLGHGWFAGAVLRKRWIACPQGAGMPIPTVGTDGKDLYYTPEYVASLSVPECMAVLAHEACHDLGLHMFRLGHREPLPWNVACDAVVNDVVGACGLKLPDGSVPAIPDQTPEALYEDLLKNAKKIKGSCNCTLIHPKDANGNDLSGAALEAAKADAKLQAATTAELAKRAGNLPAQLARLVGAGLEEKVPWERLVHKFVTQNALRDTCWKKPNRRFLTRGIVLPSLWSPDVPDFVMCCDTSGSIDDKTLRQICSEVLHAKSAAEQHGHVGQLWVVWCDTKVSAQVVQHEKDLKPVGGGGTMFSPALRWVNENVPHTKGVVYVTDGYCSDFGDTPEYPVLWVLTAPNAEFKPPFGEVACVMD